MREGRLEDIQPCTHCGTCNKNYNEVRYCRINACFGKESYDPAPLAKKKKVVVVGAGPAGMQAARVAAMRGHDVTLYEKGLYLGGAVALAGMVKGFDIEDLRDFLRFFRTQVKKTGVKVKLHKEFDPRRSRRREARRAGAGGRWQSRHCPTSRASTAGTSSRPTISTASSSSSSAWSGRRCCVTSPRSGCRWAGEWSSSAAPSRAASWAST